VAGFSPRSGRISTRERGLSPRLKAILCHGLNTNVVISVMDLHQHISEKPDVAAGFDLVSKPDAIDPAEMPIHFRLRNPDRHSLRRNSVNPCHTVIFRVEPDISVHQESFITSGF